MDSSYENKHPELEKNNRYTSPPSSLPLYELKLLQEYIHGVNLQNLGNHVPRDRKNMMLLKFFRSKRNQLIEVYSRTGEKIIRTLGKVKTVGRNFVMIETLFSRIWLPYQAIHSAKTPFGIPDVHNSHQQVVYDGELRRKLLTNFGQTVSMKETLRQQFFEELLETNLKLWIGTKLSIFTHKHVQGRVKQVSHGKLHLPGNEQIRIIDIQYIKQSRWFSFIERIFRWPSHKK